MPDLRPLLVAVTSSVSPQKAGCPILCSPTAKGGIEQPCTRRLTPLARLLQTAAFTCIMVLMLGASDPSSTRFSRIGHQMICPCGCTQVLLECNHVGCPDSDRMIGELRTQMTEGGTDTSILNWFAAKYGATVLAAPIRGGFDNVAWIAPLAVFFLATIGTAVVVRIWKLRSTATTTGAPFQSPVSGTWVSPEAAALRARIRRETEY